MRFRIIERALGGFIVEYKSNIFSSWCFISNSERIYKASMKGYFGPVPAMIFENIATAKEAIKNFKKSSRQVGKNRIVWEE